MVDLEIHLKNHPGSIAEMGEKLAAKGISIEGGGSWVIGDMCIAHFLFEDGEKAQSTLAAAGIKVAKVNEVLIQKLKQDQPGQLGKITRLMQQSGVNIEVLYSDHYNQLILVVDNYLKGKEISDEWKKVLNL